jgi:hypothetical protein
MRLILLVAFIAACVHAQIALLAYGTTTCSTLIGGNIMYTTGTCQKSPLVANQYIKASCSGGQLLYYAGTDSSCPDSGATSFTDGACISGYKGSCSYSPPSGVFTNIYTASDCSGSPSMATFLPNGCVGSGSTYLSISCPSVRACSDSSCSQNCVTSLNSTSFGTCVTTGINGYSAKIQCSSASIIQGSLIMLVSFVLLIVMF